jgi:hypothetical protein
LLAEFLCRPLFSQRLSLCFIVLFVAVFFFFISMSVRPGVKTGPPSKRPKMITTSVPQNVELLKDGTPAWQPYIFNDYGRQIFLANTFDAAVLKNTEQAPEKDGWKSFITVRAIGRLPKSHRESYKEAFIAIWRLGVTQESSFEKKQGELWGQLMAAWLVRRCLVLFHCLADSPISSNVLSI